MTDLEMARAIAAGDSKALREFVERYHASLFQYMRSLVAGRDDAEDLAIEALSQAHRKIGSFRGKSSLRTWVHRVGYHQFTHWKRRQRKVEALGDGLVATGRPFQAVDEAEALTVSLLQLPDTLRQPFILHEVNELELEEIAMILEIPVGTVKSRLHFARAKLRELLSPQMEEDHHYELRRSH